MTALPFRSLLLGPFLAGLALTGLILPAVAQQGKPAATPELCATLPQPAVAAIVLAVLLGAIFSLHRIATLLDHSRWSLANALSEVTELKVPLDPAWTDSQGDLQANMESRLQTGSGAGARDSPADQGAGAEQQPPDRDGGNGGDPADVPGFRGLCALHLREYLSDAGLHRQRHQLSIQRHGPVRALRRQQGVQAVPPFNSRRCNHGFPRPADAGLPGRSAASGPAPGAPFRQPAGCRYGNQRRHQAS